MIPTAATDNWSEIEAQCRELLPEHVLNFIDMHRHEELGQRRLIAILHMVQTHYGHLGEEHMHAVAQLAGIPHAQVTGVATFYHFFRLQPRGKHLINVCLGTACYVKGSEKIADRLKEELGITFGETSKDGLFTLDCTRCVGTCGLAPVIMVDDEVHGPVTADEVPLILEKYIKKAAAEIEDTE